MLPDYHKRKLYTAERVAFRDIVPARKFADLDEATEIIHGFQSSAPVFNERAVEAAPARYTAPVNVERSRSRARSWADKERWTIQVAPAHRDVWVLVHEMSHLMTHWAFPSHGREFNENYLLLLAQTLGDEWSDALRTQLHERRIPYTRDEAYVKYLRRNLTHVSRHPHLFSWVSVWLHDGTRWSATRFEFEGDIIVIPERATMRAATPASITLDDVAYLQAIKVGKEGCQK